MKAIARRDGQTLFDLGDGQGAILDHESDMFGRSMNIAALLNRGYWEPVGGETHEETPAGYPRAVTALEGGPVQGAVPRAADDDLRKYSADQPRDERGRWTSGGDEPTSDRGGNWAGLVDDIHRQGPGNCYKAAGTFIMFRDMISDVMPNPTLIQATVVGSRGSAIEGKRFGHSWVEADAPNLPPDFPGRMRIAYDYSSGKSVELPASLYRHMGQAADIHEYTPEEALAKMVDTGHYGPWDDTPADEH